MTAALENPVIAPVISHINFVPDYCPSAGRCIIELIGHALAE